MGQNAEAASHKAVEDPLVTKLKNMSKQSSESASGVEESSESDDGKAFRYLSTSLTNDHGLKFGFNYPNDLDISIKSHHQLFS